MPSIVPDEDDQNVYIVLDDFGPNGLAYRVEAVVTGMLEGQCSDPIRVVSFNTTEGWSQDVSADVVHEVRHRCDLQLRDVLFYLEDFVERYVGHAYLNRMPRPHKAKSSGRCRSFKSGQGRNQYLATIGPPNL
jgi:hypothetical protein